MALVNNQIYAALNLDQRFQEEVYTESLDAADLSKDVLKERRDSLVQKYRHKRLDLIVLVGPDPSESSQSRRRFPIYRIVVPVGPREDLGCVAQPCRASEISPKPSP
jgi:hypothetical protein